MKTALVCGAGGFIGHHLVSSLKADGFWVRAVDRKLPEFEKTAADEFLVLDLRERENCRAAVASGPNSEPIDEVFQLAADMGGMGFIHNAECEIMFNSSLINAYMIDEAVKSSVPRYLFSSSACVYRDMASDEADLSEEDAYPALPDNEYGWEKLYAERMAMAYARRFPIEVRVARFQNCYGPLGAWYGGREKAPAALCRKVAEVEEGGSIDIWGDGTAMRSYTFVSDLVDGVKLLMNSDIDVPVNIGSEEFVSVNQLVDAIEKVSGKSFEREHVDGPVGVAARNHRFDKIKALGWSAETSVEAGIAKLYEWIVSQVAEAQARGFDYNSVVDDALGDSKT